MRKQRVGKQLDSARYTLPMKFSLHPIVCLSEKGQTAPTALPRTGNEHHGMDFSKVLAVIFHVG